MCVRACVYCRVCISVFLSLFLFSLFGHVCGGMECVLVGVALLEIGRFCVVHFWDFLFAFGAAERDVTTDACVHGVHNYTDHYQSPHCSWAEAAKAPVSHRKAIRASLCGHVSQGAQPRVRVMCACVRVRARVRECLFVFVYVRVSDTVVDVVATAAPAVFNRWALDCRSSSFSRTKWQAKLAKFESRCELLLYLGKTLQSRFDMDHPLDTMPKLEQFFALEQGLNTAK